MKNRDDALVRKILEYCDEADEAVNAFTTPVELSVEQLRKISRSWR